MSSGRLDCSSSRRAAPGWPGVVWSRKPLNPSSYCCCGPCCSRLPAALGISQVWGVGVTSRPDARRGFTTGPYPDVKARGLAVRYAAALVCCPRGRLQYGTFSRRKSSPESSSAAPVRQDLFVRGGIVAWRVIGSDLRRYAVSSAESISLLQSRLIARAIYRKPTKA